MREFKRIKAQSFLEYAVLISLSVAVIIAMQIIYSRHLQGHFRDHTSRLGGEQIDRKIFLPGRWYMGREGRYFLHNTAWSFAYEHGIGVSFGISNGGQETVSQSIIAGIDIPRKIWIAPQREGLLDNQ